MAFTYSTLLPALDSAWVDRVQGALVVACIAISVDSPTPGLETRRDFLARSILKDSRGWANIFALAVGLGFLAKANLGAAVTDAEIDTRVSSVFNDFISQ